MHVFTPSQADIVRDTLIARFGELPSSGYLAGQAVASALYPLFGLPCGMMRDLDVFCPIEKLGHKSHGLCRSGGDTSIDIEGNSFALIGNIEKSIGGYYVSDSSVSVKNPDINFITIQFTRETKTPNDEMLRLISAFDLNCCQVAYDVKNHKLVGTEHFLQFLNDHTLNVICFSTPMHSAVRVMKKLKDMPFLVCDVDGVMKSLQTLVELVTRNGNYKSGYMVNNLFSDIYKARYENHADVLDQYFSIQPKTIVITKNKTTRFGDTSYIKDVDLFVLTANDYDHEIIQWYEQELLCNKTGSIESIINGYSVLLDTFSTTNSVRKHFKEWLNFTHPKTNEIMIYRNILLLLAHTDLKPSSDYALAIRMSFYYRGFIGVLASFDDYEDLKRAVINLDIIVKKDLLFILPEFVSLGHNDQVHISTMDDGTNLYLPMLNKSYAQEAICELYMAWKSKDAQLDRNQWNNLVDVAINLPQSSLLSTWGDNKSLENIEFNIQNSGNVSTAKDKVKALRLLIEKGVSYDTMYQRCNHVFSSLFDIDFTTDCLQNLQNINKIQRHDVERFIYYFNIDELLPEHGKVFIMSVLQMSSMKNKINITDLIHMADDWLKPYCLSLLTTDVLYVEDFENNIPF